MTDTRNKPVIPEVSPPEAMRLLEKDKNSVLLDVRSRVEFDYVGHPLGAVNVPWQEPPAWEVVPGFADEVRRQLDGRSSSGSAEDLTILTLCRSGKRSMDAAVELARNGFARVMNVDEGFEGGLDENRHRGNTGGWRFHKLPWEQT